MYPFWFSCGAAGLSVCAAGFAVCAVRFAKGRAAGCAGGGFLLILNVDLGCSPGLFIPKVKLLASWRAGDDGVGGVVGVKDVRGDGGGGGRGMEGVGGGGGRGVGVACCEVLRGGSGVGSGISS